MHRHPDLRKRKPESLSAARAAGMNETVVSSWFKAYSALVDNLGISHLPERFWNCDESGLQDQFDQGLVIGEVGSPCYRVTPGEKGETTTVMACFNARGEYAAPMIIFKAKRIKADWCTGSPPGTLVRCSDNGWISSEILVEWAEAFLTSIPDDRLPRLLLLEGHSTHT